MIQQQNQTSPEQKRTTYSSRNKYAAYLTINFSRTEYIPVLIKPDGFNDTAFGVPDVYKVEPQTLSFTSYVSPDLFGTPSIELVGGEVPFSKVYLLMHMEGSDSSQLFVNNSNYSISFSVYGSSMMRTNTFVFGSSSVYTPGSSVNHVSIGIPPWDTFADKDFCVEFRTSVSAVSFQDFWEQSRFPGAVTVTETVVRMGINAFKRPYLAFYTQEGVLHQLEATASLTLSVWYAIAVTKKAETVRIYLNGTLVGSASLTLTINTAVQPFKLAGRFRGYMDEFRVTVGAARYTSDSYTLSTSPFPDS